MKTVLIFLTSLSLTTLRAQQPTNIAAEGPRSIPN
jgi:hypothetical protein